MGNELSVINKAGVIASGTLTRASSASSGTQSVTVNSPFGVVFFASINDADATVLSDGFDTGTFATSTRSNSVTLLATLLSTNNKSNADSIYVATALGAGWRANITAISNTAFTLTWTKIGAGLNVTIKYIVIL
jgi:hypothetical protein